jgi:hypothetical protein
VPGFQKNIAPGELSSNRVATAHRERIAVGVEQLAVKSLEGVSDADHEING